MTLRVVGLGHPDRGDDAVGLLVADAVRAMAPAPVAVRRLEGSPLVLLDVWAGDDVVVVVDAVRAAAAPGAVVRLDATSAPLPVGGVGAGTHDASLVDAVELARALGRLPTRLVVYGVCGTSFDVGAAMTPAVSDAVDPLAARVVAEVTGGAAVGA